MKRNLPLFALAALFLLVLLAACQRQTGDERQTTRLPGSTSEPSAGAVSGKTYAVDLLVGDRVYAAGAVPSDRDEPLEVQLSVRPEVIRLTGDSRDCGLRWILSVNADHSRALEDAGFGDAIRLGVVVFPAALTEGGTAGKYTLENTTDGKFLVRAVRETFGEGEILDLPISTDRLYNNEPYTFAGQVMQMKNEKSEQTYQGVGYLKIGDDVSCSAPQKADVQALYRKTGVKVAESKLGLSPFSVEISDPAAVGAEVLPGGWGLTVYAKKESGTAALTVTDYWGYTAYATVQVNDYAAKVTGVVPFSDPKVLNARLHGAKCDGVTDDSAAIRSMIASFGGKGGEILFPAGTYIVSQIILREGVSMRLQGNCKEYLKTGYTDELKEKVESGTEFAVLQAAVNARNNIILNHDPGTNAARLPGDWDHAASNITFEGGMIDLHFFIPSGEQIDVDAYSSNSGGGNSNPVTSSVYFGNSKNNICAFAFSCGKNITVDGVIIKDNYNGHAMQLCAVTDTVVKDCMFAGFTIIPNSPGSVTDLRQDRETIQIEYAHANKSAGAIPPTTFKEGEFYYCQNVTVEGCYFGKSDKAGSQMICIGQHGQNGTANCTGLTIRNNFFDDPYIKGLGLLNYNDVEITGNTFYSEKPDTLGYANMIELRINQGGSSYKYHEGGADQVTVQRAESFEHDGLRNVVIRNNEFIITGNSNKRVLSVWQSGSADLLPGAATVSGRLRRVTTAAIDGSFPGESYTGFVKCTNYVSGLVFSDNRVTVNTAHEGMGDYFAAVGVRVVGMTVENNAVNGSFRDSWNGVPGWNVQKEPFSEAEANGLVFRTSLTDCAVILPDGNGGTVRVASDGSERLLSLLACDHLRLTYTITEAHEVLVNVECEDGFRFAGWKEAIPSLLTSGVTLTARTE